MKGAASAVGDMQSPLSIEYISDEITAISLPELV